MKKILNLSLIGLTFILFGCGLLDKEALEEAAGELFGGDESSGEVSQAVINDLFAGEAINDASGKLSLYYEIDIYEEKVFRLKDRTDGDNILETYFATAAILARTGVSKNRPENDPADLAGIWKAYKQTQQATTSNTKDFLIKTDDPQNNFELIVVYVDSKLTWGTKINGTPVFFTDDEALVELEEINSDVAAIIEQEKAACDARTDFTQDQIDLCKETIDKCSPEKYDDNRAFCAVADYNPCDRPDLSTDEKTACIAQVDLSTPG